MAGIELIGLHKRHGAVQALRGIDLSVRQGELLVLVGPSGCGKSTLLRTLAGLESVDEGRILLDGTDITHAPPSARRMAMVFQDYALYPHMTVRENLSFGPRMRGEPRQRIEQRLQRAVTMLQLQDQLDRRPAQLSGGQCQRVAIGRAIVQEPAVFLFDEPLSNLDAELRLRMRVEIAALHRELGSTMIHVTHDQVEAMTLGQRMVVLRAGRIEQVGTPMEIWKRPANTFVAGFIGSPAMNLLPARLTAHGIEAGGGRLGSMHGPTAPLPGVTALQVGIRPEHLLPHPDGPLRMRVDVVERLGAVSHLHGRCATDGSPMRIEWRGDELPACGDELRLRPTPGEGHVFEADGQRLGGLD